MVHEAAIAQLSHPLASLLTGELVEAQAGCTTWKYVSKGTFERFVQFAYQGDYEVVEPEPEPPKKSNINVDEELIVDEWAVRSKEKKKSKVKKPFGIDCDDAPKELEPPVEDDFGGGWGSFGISKKDKKTKKEKASLFSFEEPISERYPKPPPPIIDFKDLSYPLTTSITPYTPLCNPPTTFLQCHTYKNTFLSHAHLYVLADYWLITPLKTLSLNKLHATLRTFELDERNTPDILALARYAYQDEGRGSGDDGTGGLRELVCRFLVTHAVTLTANEGFMELMREGREFAGDMWREEVQRNHWR
jgi:hypothetical protein